MRLKWAYFQSFMSAYSDLVNYKIYWAFKID